jgi:eukaryotic translation initiation factor 2C
MLLIFFTGPWKKKCLAEFGIVTQCVAPTRVNDQYLTNVLLKINAKVCFFLCHSTGESMVLHLHLATISVDMLNLFNQLGGLNSLLQVESSPAMPLISKVPTMILGIDVSHGSPGQSGVPSIAAVSMTFGNIHADF